VFFLAVGLVFTGAFLTYAAGRAPAARWRTRGTHPPARYELQATKFNRRLLRELLLAAPSAAFLAIGSLFVLLSVGLYV
jgi:hypothetical protein